MCHSLKPPQTGFFMGTAASLVFLFSLVFAGMVPTANAAGGSQSEWNNLNQLHPEEKIGAIDMKLAKVEGLFQEFSEGSLSLKVEQKVVVLQRGQVYRVTSLEHPKRARNALIGLGVGAGVAGIIAGAAGDNIESAGAIAGVWAALIGGPVIGALIPSYRTIYRAAQAPTQPSK